MEPSKTRLFCTNRYCLVEYNVQGGHCCQLQEKLECLETLCGLHLPPLDMAFKSFGEPWSSVRPWADESPTERK